MRGTTIRTSAYPLNRSAFLALPLVLLSRENRALLRLRETVDVRSVIEEAVRGSSFP